MENALYDITQIFKTPINFILITSVALPLFLDHTKSIIFIVFIFKMLRRPVTSQSISYILGKPLLYRYYKKENVLAGSSFSQEESTVYTTFPFKMDVFLSCQNEIHLCYSLLIQSLLHTHDFLLLFLTSFFDSNLFMGRFRC